MNRKCGSLFVLLSLVLAGSDAGAEEWIYPTAGEVLLYSAIALVALIILLLLLREVFCWYWKINQRVALLQEVRDLLLNETRRMEREREIRAATPRQEPETACSQCGARYPGDLRGRFCDACGAKL